MKFLINELFTKQEIMEGKHEEINERTEKIKGETFVLQYPFQYVQLTLLEAVQINFFHNDEFQFELFWKRQGKSIRGNQRRGHNYRKKHS
jgi:hypothetical protein